MNTYIRIENNIIVEKIECENIENIFHPDIQWIPLSEEDAAVVICGYTFNGTTYDPPVVIETPETVEFIPTETTLAEMLITPPRTTLEEDIEIKITNVISIINNVLGTQAPEDINAILAHNDYNANVIKGCKLLTVSDENLNEIELESKRQALNYVAKLRARFRIEQQVGDTLDQIASISKRQASDERILFRLFLHVTGKKIMDTDTIDRYASYIEPIIDAADANMVVDRIDLEDEIEMIGRLIQEKDAITSIIQQYKEELK